jgi:hypothetical protein
MKTTRTKLNQAIVSGLHLIRPDFPIPNRTETFNTEVTTITRSLRDYDRDRMPVLYFDSSSNLGRHILSDVREVTMKGGIMGILAERDYVNALIPAADQVDGLADDVEAVLMIDGTWGGLALRTRIIGTIQSTEVEEPLAAFNKNFEIDYIEMSTPDGLATIPAGTVNLNGQVARTVTDSDPLRRQAIDKFFNAALAIPGLEWVEEPTLWPIPFEQIPSSHTPGFFFQDTGETYEYKAGTPTYKVISLQTALLALETDGTVFVETKEAWISKLKLFLSDNADLGGAVATVDLIEIRSDKSEYPLIHLECDVKVKYVQSFLAT